MEKLLCRPNENNHKTDCFYYYYHYIVNNNNNNNYNYNYHHHHHIIRGHAVPSTSGAGNPIVIVQILIVFILYFYSSVYKSGAAA